MSSTKKILSPKEVKILGFVHDMGFCEVGHIARYMGMKNVTIYGYLKTLRRCGFVSRLNVVRGISSVYTLTGHAIRELQLNLPIIRRISLGVYDHHLAMVDVALTLQHQYQEANWISERRLLRDKTHEQHFPDGVLCFPDGRQCAIEVERTQKSNDRLEEILLNYGLQNRYQEAWYMCAQSVMPQVAKLAVGMPYIKLYLLEEYRR